eukprot:CAMPEP_0116885598 /NCGR_PEP_ID=MMETSP0463-20121206/19048_1 /TAXON_ID=181622 /ORGANISM="Strombidinopsis sp, Strain SopsisLIS2011" /LENGTH=53 /DNA_ID=CAMNT_0004544379 /DNA_START=315 /DNA_END=476 /DNA_ORIENTATION=-
MSILIAFEKAVYISSNEDKDRINVRIMDPDYFIDYENVKIEDKLMTKALPPQM